MTFPQQNKETKKVMLSLVADLTIS